MLLGRISMQVTIVLCTYQGVDHLDAQLQSLIAQSQRIGQWLLSDDASADGTLAVLKSFDERARGLGMLIHLQRNATNMGYVAHFSAALARASGDVIFLCDQDDVWHKDKIEVMAAHFERDPKLLMVHSDARLVDFRGMDMGCTLFEALQLTRAEIEAIHAGSAFEVLARRSCVTGATMAFRRELVELALPVGSGWMHDEWLAIMAAAVGKIDVIEQPLIDYRQHGANQIGMRLRTWHDKWLDLRRAHGAQFRAEVARLRVLGERMDALGGLVTEDKKQSVTERCAHLERRIDMGAQRHWRRLPAVWREARAGLYRRYGTGWRSVLRDILRRD